jgi:hypothetical protein
MKKNLLKISLYAASFVLVVLSMTNCKKDNLNTAENVVENEITSAKVLGHRCLADENLQQLLETYPEMKMERSRIEDFTSKFVANYDKTATSRSVITIPVVFHVVYNTTAQNISDAQIMSQLKVLNDDFRKLNADVNKTPTPFKPLATDVEVNFVLAKQDPSGIATTGIVRKQTTKTSFGNSDAIMFSAQGGSDIWDSKNYLNIYCCNYTKGLGYAYYPGTPANIDGAVINFKAFGTIGTAQAPYHLGRTVTHEVGHWLNLEHVFGADPKNGDVCSGTDDVADTPNQGVANYGVPTFPKISCGNTPHGDMFMNYMDYSDDISLYMFTKGQKARMQALFALGGKRVGLLTSKGLEAPGTSVSCTDNYESNNTSSTAKPILTNINISANIGTATDVDWFSFSNTTTQKNIKVTLSNLPDDYDIYIYRNGILIDFSENEDNLAEEIILNNAATGTYRIKIVGFDGAYNAANCYTLNAQIGSTSYKLEHPENKSKVSNKEIAKY